MKTIKEAVREKYAKAATEAASCCEPSCCDAAGAKLVDYEGVPGVVPESDLGLGCGTPTQYANLKPGETVLDLGSGAGIDVFLAAQQVGESGRVIGIDIALPVDDASVDVVISNCVINLVPDKRSVYSEMHRVLRPGGRFIVSDMVTYGTMPEAVKKDLELWAGCVAGALDRQEYLRIIADAGFERVIIKKESTYDSPDKTQFGLQSVTLEGWKQS